LEVPYELDLILLELIVSSYIGKVLLLNVIKLLSQRKINHIQYYLGLISLYTLTLWSNSKIFNNEKGQRVEKDSQESRTEQ
jgi:hypothetical protein